MNENEIEVIDSTIDTETTENEVVEETTEQEDAEALRKKIQTLEAQKEHWRKKAEKVEAPKVQVKSETGLTAEDVLDLTGSGMTHKEDIELARTWAKNSGKSLREILDDKIFKTALEVQREERKSADTTQTKGGVRAVSKLTGEDLLKKAKKGDYPESEEDIDRMLDAKFEARKQALKRN